MVRFVIGVDGIQEKLQLAEITGYGGPASS